MIDPDRAGKITLLVMLAIEQMIEAGELPRGRFHLTAAGRRAAEAIDRSDFRATEFELNAGVEFVLEKLKMGQPRPRPCA